MFVGMYRTWFASSRFDEISTLFKTLAAGIFVIFFFILYDDFTRQEPGQQRFLIFLYWGNLFSLAGAGRLFMRSFQRYLLIRGYGRRNAVIIGFNSKANKIHRSISRFKALGLDVRAYASVDPAQIGEEYDGIPVIDTIENIDKVVDQVQAKEVIFALEKHEDDLMISTIAKCDDKNIRLKIVPDLYEIIGGQARTSQIYGFPLIDIMPQLMPEWEKKMKRLLDIVVSFAILLLASPFILLTMLAIKIDSKGPIFYKQERMGLNGRLFKVIKFRSMISDAEKHTGPMWSTKNDPRITKVGRFIRLVRIDELPQIYNVLKGEMSLVGPRPERPYFVEKLSEEIPLYRRRLKVRPGLTGWAQVKHKYDENVEDVKVKLKYDLFYIENISLRMDIKILLRTIYVVLFGKGHQGE